MIIEPVQGEGGFIVPPKEYLPGLAEICRKNDMLLIVDEVQTGFGRTGNWFAVNHFDVVPDIMTFAKSIASGLPLSAVVGRADVMDAPTKGRVGSTFGGNPVACVAALATLERMEKEKLPQKAFQIGLKLTARMKRLQEKYHAIGDVRSLGAMVGIEFVKDPRTKEPAKDDVTAILLECSKRGLIVLGAGIFSNVIRFLPPLILTPEQLEKGISIFEEAVAAVYDKG